MLTSGTSWEGGRLSAPSLTVEDKRLLEQSEVSLTASGSSPRALKLEDSKAEEYPEGVSTSAKWRKLCSPRTKDMIRFDTQNKMLFTLTKYQNQGRSNHLQGQKQSIVLSKVIIINPWLLLSNLSTITQEFSRTLLRNTSHSMDNLEEYKVIDEDFSHSNYLLKVLHGGSSHLSEERLGDPYPKDCLEPSGFGL